MKSFEGIRIKERASRAAFEGEWGLGDALTLIKRLEQPLRDAGWGIALGGSVLVEGHSKNDLDLVLFPTDSTWLSCSVMRDILLEHDLRMVWSRAEIAKFWENYGGTDAKHVEVWREESTKRRVDIFVLR